MSSIFNVFLNGVGEALIVLCVGNPLASRIHPGALSWSLIECSVCICVCAFCFFNECDTCTQELLETVEQERRIRFNPTTNSTIFHHPTLGDFELQHLPIGVNDSALEGRIIQHLAAAVAMGRTHHVGRREGSRNRSAAHNHPQFLVFSTNPNAPSAGPVEEQAQPISELAAFAARGGGIVQHMPASGMANQPNNQQGTTVVHRYSRQFNFSCGYRREKW